MSRQSTNPYVGISCLVSLLIVAVWPVAAWAVPPVITVPGAQFAVEQQPLAFGVSATDADGQICQLRAFSLPAGASFVDHVNNTGSFDWTPASDQSGSYSVAFRADDGFGGTNQKSVAISVANANAAPNLGFIADRTLDPGTMAILSFWASDDDGDPLVFTVDNLPSYGQFTDFGDGTAGMILAPSMSTPPGTTTMTMNVSDAIDVTSQSFSVTVSGAAVQHPPVLAAFTAPTVAEGASASVTLSGSDPDGGTLTWSSALPSFATLTPLAGGSGTASARLDVAPGYCAAGDHTASVTLNDGNYADQESFTLHVTDTPRTPVWSAPAAGASFDVLVGSDLSVDLAASDPDQACGDAAPVLTVASSDAGGSLTLSLEGGSLHVVANAPGTFHVTLRATDATDALRFADRSLTVVSSAPVGPAEAVAWCQPHQIRMETGSDWERVYVEPRPGSFSLEDVDPSSFKLKAWEGAGDGLSVCPSVDAVLKGTDVNENGRLEYRLTFMKDALQGMFSKLTEPTDGLLTVTFRLYGGAEGRAQFTAQVVPEKKRAIKRAGPNPLNPEAVIAVETETPGRLRVMVFDVHGRMVRVLANEANAPAGVREFHFNGRDDRGNTLRAGRYYIRVESTMRPDATSLTILP
ncbi:MAG TPA: Ig-like domain-containing protein [Candidatus Eisenbacteria bacterium]|nr:Ig-like domain-containing protein [Candidatus Eisenbacteria bacterium]